MLSSSWWIVFRVKIVFEKERKNFKNNFGWKVRGHGPRGPSRSYTYVKFWPKRKKGHQPRVGTRREQFGVYSQLQRPDPTDPTRPDRDAVQRLIPIFWTKLPTGKWSSPSGSHIQWIIRISIVTISIHRRTRDRCGKRPYMLARKPTLNPKKPKLFTVKFWTNCTFSAQQCNLLLSELNLSMPI